MRRSLAFLILAAALAAPLPAAPDARFRADDAGLWHLEDNPAFMGMGADHLLSGIAYDATQAQALGGGPGALRLATLVPILGYYDLNLDKGAFSFLMGGGFPLGSGFGLGFDFDWSSASNKFDAYSLGLLLRPASFLSVGLTTGLQSAGFYQTGLGLALRPLAGLSGSLARSLTLSGDLTYGEAGFGIEELGCRLRLADIADLRAWFAPAGIDLASGSFGLELRLSLGPTSLGAMSPSVASSPLPWLAEEELDVRLSEMRKGQPSLPTASLGRRILVVKDVDRIEPLPARDWNPLSLASTQRSLGFRELLDLLEEARRLPGVEAVAFEKLPPLAGAAAYQELAEELALLRAAGKKVYFYGEVFGREYEILASQADAVFLNPGGMLAMRGYGYHRLYFKGLFGSLGLRFVNLAPWDTKSAFNSFTDSSMPPGEAAMMRRFYGEVQDQLAASLAAGRGGRIGGGVEAALEGGPYLIASEAVDRGLVDGLAYEGEFEAGLLKAHPGARLVSGLGNSREGAWAGEAFRPKAAVVWLSGTIGAGKGRAGQDIGSLAATELERLRKDDSVAGIVLRVDSPGGSALTSDLIARELRMAVDSGKPVVVSMGEYAASGGYYISAPASWIVAEPLSLTGSIGVTGLVPNISGALAKLGITYDGFDLAPGASFLDPSKELDEAELARTRAMILSIYDRFVDVVAAGRRLDREVVKGLGEGQIWTGREARQKGLVDDLGGLEKAKAWLEARLGKRLSFVDIMPGEEPSLLSSVPGLTSALKAGKGSSLEGLLEPLADRLRLYAELGSGPQYFLDSDALDGVMKL